MGTDTQVLVCMLLRDGNLRERIGAVDIHGTRTADALTARTTESEGRVHLVFDLAQEKSKCQS